MGTDFAEQLHVVDLRSETETETSPSTLLTSGKRHFFSHSLYIGEDFLLSYSRSDCYNVTLKTFNKHKQLA